MSPDRTLHVAPSGDCGIVMTRFFAAPRPLVFDAWTRPELVRRWLGQLAGWTFEVCEIDLRPGGTYRYVWRHANGHAMGMGGTFLEVEPPERYVGTEKFDEAWYPGEAVGTFLFTEQDGGTLVTQTMVYASRAARDAVLASPMESGVASSFDQLEAILGADAA